LVEVVYDVYELYLVFVECVYEFYYCVFVMVDGVGEDGGVVD